MNAHRIGSTDDVIEIGEILRRLPHRYPFLLIDRAIDYIPNKSIRGIKNVTINEPFFTGHFPHRPVMPGVLMLEALAQAAAMIERQQHVMQRAMDAWDTTTHQKNGDGRLWQCMEELRGECGKQPNSDCTDPRRLSAAGSE